MSLSGNLWPIHPKPLPNELLSSWMIRLAHANGLKVMTLATMLFGYRRPIWNRDIDKLASTDILKRLAEITGTHLDRVQNTTLRSLEGRLFEKMNPKGNSRWILPLGIHHRDRHGYGLQFCPQCLKEDAYPYFRLSWRIGFITVCTKHNLVLLDRCPSCQSPVAPHRADMTSRTNYPTEKQITQCSYCGKNLAIPQKAKSADIRLLKSQASWEKAMSSGWIEWAGNTSMYSFLFFDGLRAICTGLTKRSDQDRLTGPLKPIQKIAEKWPANGVEFAPTSTRNDLLTQIVKLIDSWPDTILDAAKENRLRYSSLCGSEQNLPFWYEHSLRKSLYQGSAPISRVEASSIVNTIEFHYGKFTNNRSRELFGKDLAKQTREYCHPRLSLDTCEQLLASIDHEIAGTIDKTKRLELLRDKTMFAIARVFHLTISNLSKLTIQDVRLTTPITVNPYFTQIPNNIPQARAWAEWYFFNIRPHLKPHQNETKLFVSSNTHHGLKRSIISSRFKRASETANLTRVITSYKKWIYSEANPE